jgi:hypothetical protein
MFISNCKIVTSNGFNGGITTNTRSFLENVIISGRSNTCQVGLECKGGSISNVIFDGVWLENGSLNLISDSDVSTVMNNITVNTVSDVSFTVNGSLSDIANIGTGSLVVNVQSNSEVYGANLENMVLLSGASNISIEANGVDDIYFSPDNTNNRIMIKHGNFNNIVEIYGTNIDFMNCNFIQGFKTNVGSTGTFIGCTTSAGSSVTQNGTFRKVANDSSIGNDY